MWNAPIILSQKDDMVQLGDAKALDNKCLTFCDRGSVEYPICPFKRNGLGSCDYPIPYSHANLNSHSHFDPDTHTHSNTREAWCEN